MGMPGSRRRAVDRLVLSGEIGKPGCLQQAVGDIDAEAIDTAIEPEPQDVQELIANLIVVPIEIRLPGVEQMQIPLAVRLVHPSPCRAAELRLPVVGRLVTLGALADPEVVAGT